MRGRGEGAVERRGAVVALGIVAVCERLAVARAVGRWRGLCLG